MRKIAFITLLTFVLFISCKKDKQVQKNHMSYIVKGQKIYWERVFAYLDTAAGFTLTLEILGTAGPSPADYMRLYMVNIPTYAPIIPDDYQGDSQDYMVTANYKEGSKLYEAGKRVVDSAKVANIVLSNQLKFNITYLDKSTIKGTFSGDYYLNRDPKNGEKITITDGEFIAPVHNP